MKSDFIAGVLFAYLVFILGCMGYCLFRAVRAAKRLVSDSPGLQSRVNVVKRTVHDAVVRANEILSHSDRANAGNVRGASASRPDPTKQEVERTHKASLGQPEFGVVFEPNKRWPAEHMRLNAFAGVSSISFEKDVLSRLSEKNQSTARLFFAKVAASLENDCPVDKSRFYQVPDQFTMLRFLQADKYDQDKALVRIRNTLAFRQRIGLDEFISNPNWKMVARYRQLRVRVCLGLDKNGLPLSVERLGDYISSDEAFKGGFTMEQWALLYSFDSCETMAVCRMATELTGKYVHKVNYIADTDGARLLKVYQIIASMKTVAKNIEDNFPEVVDKITLMNAPSFAARAWNFVKPFLDPTLAAKITIVAGKPSALFVKTYGSTVLPVSFGGTNPYELPKLVAKCTDEFNAAFPLA